MPFEIGKGYSKIKTCEIEYNLIKTRFLISPISIVSKLFTLGYA